MAGQFSAFSNLDAGGCPSPFVAEDLYPYTGGWLGSRNCQKNVLSSNETASRCCLPCPLLEYIYPDDFNQYANGAAWIHVAAFILCSFLLISMIVLPKESRRAYLNIVLLVGVLIFDLGFIIPLARSPPDCYDRITQNDQSSNFTCAISGFFLAFGAMFLVAWILVRALFMHLQIVWDTVPGTKWYIAANVAVFSTCIALVVATLAHGGVSMKWGHYCHVNLGSYATFWGWLLAFAAISFLLQVATFGYVMKVYIRSAVAGGKAIPSTQQSGSLKGSSAARQARATARRVKKVILLQWRSLAIVTVAIFTASFACITFVVNNSRYTTRIRANDGAIIFPWIVCLVTTQDKNQCLGYIKNFAVTWQFIVAALFVMGFAGVWAFLLLCRVDIFKGWWALIARKRGRQGSDDSFLDRTAARNAEQHTADDEKLVNRESPVVKEDEIVAMPTRAALRDEKLGPLHLNPVSPLEPHAV